MRAEASMSPLQIGGIVSYTPRSGTGIAPSKSAYTDAPDHNTIPPLVRP
ncbi:hypothetical protein [Paenibacillus sp. 37]|nr:hypothetical protein [Paenibacillus sp. 37]